MNGIPAQFTTLKGYEWSLQHNLLFNINSKVNDISDEGTDSDIFYVCITFNYWIKFFVINDNPTDVPHKLIH